MLKLVTAMMLTLPATALAAQTTGAAVSPEQSPQPAVPSQTFALPVRIVPATASPVATAPQPLICKTTVVTGSLIARRKQCLTKAQWRYVDDVNQQFVHKLQEDNAGKSPGF